MKAQIKKYVNKRIEQLKTYMLDTHLDAVLITSPENVFYYSNFNPILTSHPAWVLISLEQDDCLLVHAIRHDHARVDGVLDNVQLYGKWGAHTTLDMHPAQAVRKLIGEKPLRIGLEFRHLSVTFWQELRSKLKIVCEQDISQELTNRRLIKDEYELSCMRKAAHLTDVGVATMLESYLDGYNEAEACTEAQYKMRKTWHEQYQKYEVSGFSSPESGIIDSCMVWSMANERIAYGCDCPQDYKPIHGDLVLPMAWAKVGGYSAENERTMAIGEVTDERHRAYTAMLRARESMFNIIKPGVSFEELYLSAVNVFTEAGFGNILPGRVGHGIGLSAHEPVSLTAGNTVKLAQGMTFTVEPGLMTTAWGGVRHSDTVVVTENGFEFLTALGRGYIQL